MISIDDVSAVEIKLGTILEAALVPNTDKLIQLTVDFGEEKRTIVSGIAHRVDPEYMVGKQFPFITNLEPRTIRGVESNGMILAASSGEELALLCPHKEMPAGTRVG